MESIICVAGVIGCGINLFLLAWADRTKSFDALFTLTVMLLHYYALTQILAGYHFIVDILLKSPLYAIVNSIIIPYWFLAIMKYYAVYKTFRQKLRQ